MCLIQGGLMLKNKEIFILGINKRKINNEVTTYAQIIKSERLKRHLTLEEASKDICSVSYLCKLENSTIKTNETFIKSLCERFSLNYNALNDAALDSVVNDLIKYLFYNRYSDLYALYEKVERLPSNSGAKLVKGFYYLFNHRYLDLEDEINKLDVIKFTLTESESILLIYLIVLYNIFIYNFLEAYHYLKLIDMIRIENKQLEYMLIEANILVSYNIDNSRRMLKAYEKYEMIGDVAYPIGRRLFIKMIYYSFLSKEYPYECIDDVNNININEVPNESKIDILYYKALINLNTISNKTKKNDLFRKIINEMNYLDARFLGLLAYICYKEDDEDYYKELMSICENYYFQDYDIIHQRFVCFILMYHTTKQKESILKYLKEEIVPIMKVEMIPLYRDVYRDIYSSLLVQNSKYKDAYYFIQSIKTTF